MTCFKSCKSRSARLNGRVIRATPFPLPRSIQTATAGHGIADKRLLDARTGAAVTFDFRFLSAEEERVAGVWAKRSD
jgi:hypothetical protein